MVKGFTLIEVMVAVMVLVVIALGGSLVLFKTLSSRGQNQADINIIQDGSEAMQALEQSLRFARVDSIGSTTRTGCLSAGSSGVSGGSMTVEDDFGTSSYSLNSGKIASVSSSTKYLSSDDVTTSGLTFTWYCVSGSYDKVGVDFTMSAGGVTRTFSRDINMYNSGI